jgi:putative PEP-CTERM system histidine kinase
VAEHPSGMIVNYFLSLGAACLCIALAAFVLVKDRRSFSHVAFTLGMLALALTQLFLAASIRSSSDLDILYWRRLGAISGAVAPGAWLLFSLCYGQVDYRHQLTRWRWVLAAAIGAPLVTAVGFGGAIFARTPDTPASVGIFLGPAGKLLYVVALVSTALTLANLETTFRASAGVKRSQVKFMILGLGGFLVVQIYTASQVLLFSIVTPAMDALGAFAVGLSGIVVVVALYRAGHFHINIYLAPTALYNSLTILVVGTYLVAVGGLAHAMNVVGGAWNLPLSAFVVFISLLVLTIVLLSEKLRWRFKRFIARNFRRPDRDHRTVWSRIVRQTAPLVDRSALCAAACRIISETYGVSSVTIWLLVDESSEIAFGGSTVLSRAPQGDVQDLAGLVEIAHYMRDVSEPVDFRRPPDARAEAIARAHDKYCAKAGIRYCAALCAGGRMMGIVTLSDLAGKDGLSLEDGDLLKALVDQVAGNLLNRTLSERLASAKELEAFQTTSAFFVHDLKNLASMLSLTVQNLPTHFDNPAFRTDMLRVITETVGKMNWMCERLSMVRNPPTINPRHTDLNDLVASTITNLNGGLKARVVQKFAPLPEVPVDANEMRKVLVNLLLNANDALSAAGEIRVETARLNSWAAICVADNGCGMSKDFVSHQLFKRFQTTKAKGLGIGLVHSKMIVDAHHGRIDVESKPGKGSTFRVLLPLAPVGGTSQT